MHTFVLVSHVWHDSIYNANKHAKLTRVAISTVLSTLKALFKGAKDAYLLKVKF
jgi:hypothetical protein